MDLFTTKRVRSRRGPRAFRPLLEFLEDRITPTSQPFSVLAPGLTQELVATLPGASNSGYAFDSHNNPYTISFSNNHLYKIDLSTTITQNGSTIHPLVDMGVIHFPNGQQVFGGNFTSYPDGSVYLDAQNFGPLKVDLSTATVTSTPIPGAPGGQWGIAVDPQLNAAGHHNIFYFDGNNDRIAIVDPVAGTFLGHLGNAQADGIAVDPSGNYVFSALGTLNVTARSGAPIGNYPGTQPDGIAFANTGTKQFVATADGGQATVSEWDFPGNDFSKPPTRTVLAAGAPSGTYLDQANVSPDGYFYLTYWSRTVFADGTVTGNASVVRIGPAGTFIPPTHSDSISLSPASDAHAAGSEVLTATVAESTNGGPPAPVSGKTVTFTVIGGPDQGQSGTALTNGSGQATFTLLNQHGLGTDFVQAQFVDANGTTQTSNNSTITFTNQPPVATDAAYTTYKGGTLTETAGNGVLAHVTDAENDPQHAVLVSGPAASQGTVTLNDDGSFVFTPTAGFTGDATFTFKSHENVGGGLDSGPATVTVHVLSPAHVTSVAHYAATAAEETTYHQRSMIDHLQVTFDQAVVVDPSTFSLMKTAGPGGTGAVNVTIDAASTATVYILDISGPLTQYGSLMDGSYTLTVNSAHVFTPGVGGPGGFLANASDTTGTNYTDAFFRLFGDSMGRGHVDNLDYANYRKAVNGDAMLAAFMDFRGDHSLGYTRGGTSDLDYTDFSAFLARLNKSRQSLGF